MLTQGWTVWCERGESSPGRVCCEHDSVSGTKRAAITEFKRSGWRFVRKDGARKSLCPSCARELDAGAKPLRKQKSTGGKPGNSRLQIT